LGIFQNHAAYTEVLMFLTMVNYNVYKIAHLDFAHLINYKIITLQTFEMWILFPSSGKMGEENRQPNAGPTV
jgi:hypothetical protein